MDRTKHFWIRLAILAAFGVGAIPATAHAAIVGDGDLDPSDPNDWTSSTDAYIGKTGTGSVSVTDGSTLRSRYSHIGFDSGSAGEVIVSGEGSTWTNNYFLYVGYHGTGTLNITGSASASNTTGSIGYYPGSTGEVTVSGEDSTWINSDDLYVGRSGTGTLNITNGGLVISVVGTLIIDYDEDNDSFLNMSTGGMLALAGEADDSLDEFLDLIDGTDAIRWRNNAFGDWDLLATATMGTDYTLEYLADGDLAGYTLLTVLSGWVPGDANGDGKVDGSDVTILANHWQAGVDDDQLVTWAMGDFNGDGQVDGSDVTILANNWQYGVTATTAAVPEPSVVLLIVSALLALGSGFLSRSELKRG